ncbi:MAG: hypothetical protein ACE5IR_15470 [bacterium]
MKTDSTVVAMMVASVLLLLLIAWVFYQALQLDSDRKIKIADYPQKAVMLQARAMNQAHLEELAKKGKVAKGMSMKLVRLALGEPEHTEQIERDNEHVTTWWYQHNGWMNVVFDRNGIVVGTEKQP